MPTMQTPTAATREARPLARYARIAAACLLAYGAVTIFLQLEVVTKLVRGAMGYGGWAWGGPLSDLPTAWSAPTVEEPVRGLYSALTLRQPLLPWIAWVVGAVVLIWTTGEGTRDEGQGTRDNGNPKTNSYISRFTFYVSRIVRRPSSIVFLLLGFSVFALGAWLRTGNLLPGEGGRLPGSNFDEMVYYTMSELWVR